MSARGRLARGALAGLAALVVVEVVLRLCDWGAGGAGRYAGLDEGAAYLVPAGGGAWRTTMFADEMPAHDRLVPPRDGRRRVLLLGGSNSQGFPEDVLERRLAEAAPGPGWEVVNLGRSGYGSERVRILLDQALARLDPDVVVLYVGHNEFMEPGLATAACARGLPPWVLRAANVVLRSHLAGAVATLAGLDVPERRAPGRPPEPRRGRDARHARMDPACTRVVWRAYRDNLEHMVAAARARGCAVVLCTLAGNPLTEPYTSTFAEDVPQATRGRAHGRVRAARERLPRRLVEGLVPRGHPHATAWGQNLTPHQEEQRRARALATRGPNFAPRPLRPLLGAFADPPHTTARKAASAEGAHWPDPRLWTDDVVAFVERQRAVLGRAVTDAERADLEWAAALYEEALALVPDHPDALYGLGLARWLLGEDDAAAVALLGRAADADRAPRHANARSNALVRAVAASADPDGVVLLDVARLVAQRCPDGLAAFDVLLDECHLQPGVRVVLMQDLVGPIVAASGAAGGAARR